MKFKDKDGNVFEDITMITKIMCDKFGGCSSAKQNTCPLAHKAPYGTSCNRWAQQNPAEAARLMGYEVVEEAPGKAAGEEEEVLPCRWCKDEICVNADSPMRADYCPVPDTPGVCRHEDRAPRFTEEEVADARVLARALRATGFKRNRYEDIYATSDDAADTLLDSNMFPSIHPGQSVKLSEIVEENGR